MLEGMHVVQDLLARPFHVAWREKTQMAEGQDDHRAGQPLERSDGSSEAP